MNIRNIVGIALVAALAVGGGVWMGSQSNLVPGATAAQQLVNAVTPADSPEKVAGVFFDAIAKGETNNALAMVHFVNSGDGLLAQAERADTADVINRLADKYIATGGFTKSARVYPGHQSGDRADVYVGVYRKGHENDPDTVSPKTVFRDVFHVKLGRTDGRWNVDGWKSNMN